jgi:hypothetical protein
MDYLVLLLLQLEPQAVLQQAPLVHPSTPFVVEPTVALAQWLQGLQVLVPVLVEAAAMNVMNQGERGLSPMGYDHPQVWLDHQLLQQPTGCNIPPQQAAHAALQGLPSGPWAKPESPQDSVKLRSEPTGP